MNDKENARMSDTDKILSFSDMVKASKSLCKPWIILCGLLLAALVITNAIWGFVHWKQLQYAYMTPIEVEQGQQFEQKTQSQAYRDGSASGD